MKVSVVVPVYNPGEHFEPCLRSLLAQTMPVSEHELIFVDDGSTDGSAARLDEVAARHPHVHVRHIPNSGWPGRPRNIGLDMARGEFVYFVDNDDWLGEEALERLYRTAVADDADIVIGKVVGHGKGIPLTVFERNVHDAQAVTAPLGLLTPHKLFRRSMLERDGIRFPEGRRRLEDHVMVVSAYFAARRIAVLADYPCYHWVYIGAEQNASMEPIDPAGYYDNVREVLDIVDANVEPGPVRDRMYVHWLRSKALARMGGERFARRDPQVRHETGEAVGALMQERFPPRLDELLPYSLRLRARLVRDGADDALLALAAFEADLRGRAQLRKKRGNGTWLTLRAGCRLRGRENGPPVFVRRGGAIVWEPPEPLRAALPPVLLDVTDALAASRVQIVLRSLEDGAEYTIPTDTRVSLPETAEGEPVDVRMGALARVAPTIAAAGAPLPGGAWSVRAVIEVAGFTAAVPVKEDGEPLELTSVPPARIYAGPAPEILPTHQTVHRVPRLRRTVGRLRAAGGRAGRGVSRRRSG